MINITGRVIQGQKYGRVLGFPTANLDRREYVRKKLKLKTGIYAGKAIIGKRHYKAGVIITPPDKTGRPKIESHLINFKGNIYGEKMTVVIGRYLRPYKKFKNIETLKKQILKDINLVKKYG